MSYRFDRSMSVEMLTFDARHAMKEEWQRRTIVVVGHVVRMVDRARSLLGIRSIEGKRSFIVKCLVCPD
jgi:hypothetical protein